MKRSFRLAWPVGIRMQLMIWYTLVFIVLLFLSDAILYTQLQNMLTKSLDTGLQLQAEHIASGITNDNGTLIIQDVTGDLPDTNSDLPAGSSDSSIDITFGTLIRIVDVQGRTLRSTPAFRTLILPAEIFTQSLHDTSWQGNVVAHDGQEVRLYSTTLTENGIPFAVVQVGESLVQLNTSLRSVMIELIIIAPFALLLGAIGSYWLAARAFIPIDRLIHIAKQINAGDLQQRVPLPRTRDEVQRLAQTFNEMIGRLDAAFARQRRFVADASHELRTPVAVIRSITDLALLEGQSPSEYKGLLEKIHSEAERLGHLISDLLALARSDEGKTLLEWEPVHLDRMVEVVVANAEVLASERGITLHAQVQEKVTIEGDEARLIQVVMNLLDNAILYTDSGGRVTLRLAKKDDQVYLTIEDTGTGIAPEHLPHIFERFYRADPARAVSIERNSSGLGLAIVEWVVQAHGGKVMVESQVGKGSIFVVTLPLAPPSLSRRVDFASEGAKS